MKATKIYPMRILLNICLICICSQGWTQQAGTEDPVGPDIERYTIVTDRGLYIVGEDINFRVFNHGLESMQKMKWSSVFYMELISPQGYSHSQAKFALDSTGVSSAIQVPENLPSGTYYLKGYTRWMRNNGPDTYAYLSVEIVNPYSKTMVPVDTVSDFSMTKMEHATKQTSEVFVSGNFTGAVETRSPVSLNLKRDLSELSVDCCVSVTRKGMQKTQWVSPVGTTEISSRRRDQLPETRGVSLVGLHI